MAWMETLEGIFEPLSVGGITSYSFVYCDEPSRDYKSFDYEKPPGLAIMMKLRSHPGSSLGSRPSQPCMIASSQGGSSD